MIKIFICLLFIVYCLLISACGNNSPETPSVEAQTNSAKNVFEENCVLCHGSDGKLCSLGAKDLRVSVMDKRQIIGIIMNGKNRMPPYKSLLTTEEIERVADYVQTLKK